MCLDETSIRISFFGLSLSLVGGSSGAGLASLGLRMSSRSPSGSASLVSGCMVEISGSNCLSSNRPSTEKSRYVALRYCVS